MSPTEVIEVESIERKDETFIFPWQMGVGVKLLSSLPRPLLEVAANKMR